MVIGRSTKSERTSEKKGGDQAVSRPGKPTGSGAGVWPLAPANGFTLTPAVRPAPQAAVSLREGYRIDTFHDPDSNTEIPMLVAAVSHERLFEVFFGLLDVMNDVVDVIVESHHQQDGEHGNSREFLREHIDLPIFKSYCHDYRDILLNDGFLGLAVVDPRVPSEIQFDDHKMFVVFSKDLNPFKQTFEKFDVHELKDLHLITEGEHLHTTSPHFADRCEQFCYAVNAD